MITKNQQARNYITFGQMNLLMDNKDNWQRLAMWIRSVFGATLSGFGNLEASINKLYSIPMEFYSTLLPFFGRAVSEAFVNLLSAFIVNVVRLANAMKNRDTQAVNDATVALYNNANDISYFLAQINPYWSEDQWRNLLDQFIRMLNEQIVEMTSENHEREIAVYDRILQHTSIMAEYMARGMFQFLTEPILNQAPNNTTAQ